MNTSHEKELIDVIHDAAKDKTVLKDFLRDLLTPNEYSEFINRWQIVKRLTKGETHRSIASELKIGIATVNRGAHALESEQGGFKKMLKKLRLLK